MKALCLMPSHTYFYKKLDEFGMDHNKEILTKVENESKRKEVQAGKLLGSSAMADEQKDIENNSTTSSTTSHDQDITTDSTICSTISDGQKVRESKDTTSSMIPDVLKSTENNSTTTQTTSQSSTTLRKRILESFVQIHKEDCQEELQPAQKNLVVFPTWKKDGDMTPIVTNEASSRNIDKTLTRGSKHHGNAEVFPSDTGRKFVLDNVDVHQITHDMTKEYQNPDAHYCSLMVTENRVSGNHLSDEKPICDLNDLENGECCPSKFEHSQQHDNYVHLVSRVITKELPCLNFLQDAIMSHIPHMYSKEMHQKTDTVSRQYNDG